MNTAELTLEPAESTRLGEIGADIADLAPQSDPGTEPTDGFLPATPLPVGQVPVASALMIAQTHPTSESADPSQRTKGALSLAADQATAPTSAAGTDTTVSLGRIEYPQTTEAKPDAQAQPLRAPGETGTNASKTIVANGLPDHSRNPTISSTKGIQAAETVLTDIKPDPGSAVFANSGSDTPKLTDGSAVASKEMGNADASLNTGSKMGTALAGAGDPKLVQSLAIPRSDDVSGKTAGSIGVLETLQPTNPEQAEKRTIEAQPAPKPEGPGLSLGQTGALASKETSERPTASPVLAGDQTSTATIAGPYPPASGAPTNSIPSAAQLALPATEQVLSKRTEKSDVRVDVKPTDTTDGRTAPTPQTASTLATAVSLLATETSEMIADFSNNVVSDPAIGAAQSDRALIPNALDRVATLPMAPELPKAVSMQIAEAVSRFPDQPVELTLSPEELGRVRLTLTTTEAGLTMSVMAERSETLDMMRRHIEQLAQEFRDLGFGDVSFSFDQQTQDNTQAERLDSDGHDTETAQPIIPTPHSPQPVRLSLDPAQGLDIRF